MATRDTAEPIAAGARIGHVHLKVADLDRAIGFYRGVLGFELTQRLGSQAAFLSAGGYHHHIGLNTWESEGGSWPPPGATGLYHLAILYPTRAELATALRRLIEARIPLEGASDHGVSEALYLRDLDGNGVELYWDRPREEWPRDGSGGLAMFTRRLDLDDLLRAAPPERRVSLDWLRAARRRLLAARRHDLFQLSLPFLAPAPPEEVEERDARDTATTAKPRSLALGSDGAGWSKTWGVPDLRYEVRLELSHRMRSSLGGFYARERLIRIADTLLEAPPHLLQEVLCHEAAHAAVEILHGPRARSHGREWKELMRRIGLEPRVHVPGAELGDASQRAARKRWVWRHRCPHCRAERLAGRPVRQWRCRPCQDAGGDGKLVVTRVAARALRSPR